jgi:hypothetical protein
VEPTLERDVDEAFATIQRLGEVGIDFRGVTDELQTQGVDLFTASYEKARDTIRSKMKAAVS